MNGVAEQVAPAGAGARSGKRFPQRNGTQEAEPTSQQKSYLRFLAQATGARLDVSRVQSREAASRLIAELRQRQNGNAVRNGANDQRDRRIAFGMATKLVYMQWVETHHTPGKPEHFWKEVTELFRQYEKHQEAALRGRPTAQEVTA